MASGVIDGKLYLAGGATNGEILATLLVYDPGTNTWAEKSPMPTARDFPAGAVIDGQLYVVTGIVDFDSPPVRTVEVYDPATDTWRAAAPIPTGRDRLGEVGIIGGKLYVVGGWNPCFACDIATLEVFEPTGAQICVQPPSGLVSWWPGDENADDIVGGRNAVLRNDATFSLGLVDQAFMLDGDGDFIEVPHDSALNVGTGDFTVDLWVFFNDTAGEQVLVEKWIQRFPCTPCEGWTFTKLEGNFLHMALFSGDGSGELVFSEVLTIPPGTWRHFAARRQSGEITLFMNGAPVASGKFSGNLDSISSLKFGHRGSPSDTPGSEDERGFFLNGRIDEVEVFVGQALSDAEILAIFNAGSAGKCKGPVARVPTSTEQCKKGGWMNLTDDAGRPFKNQGDCVSFVATRGKNPAGG
jgi:Concanavalin A-like lectin/glucanases superfamily/Kelch motif